MIIAVDGPTASGKGTISKKLAAHGAVPHLDPGRLYRAVGRQPFLNGGDADKPEDALAAVDFPDSLLDDPMLRDEKTGSLASKASIHPAVRKALFDRQVAFAQQDGGAVLDGRDIGTVIAPDADVKLFITASVESRAARRHKEMQARGSDVTLEAMAADLRQRDDRDTNRKDAPLLAADDAFVIDTSELDIDEAFAAALKAVEVAST
jgi:cytidylate kinase